MSRKSFKRGERVALHPATDLWMRGYRFATVVRRCVGRLVAHRFLIEFDDGTQARVHEDNLESAS